MAEFLIAFNDDWVPSTGRRACTRSRGAPAVAGRDGRGWCPDLHRRPGRRGSGVQCRCVERYALFTDGPFVEDQGALGGFAVVDVADEEAARWWAGKIAVACGWPQEVRRFQVPMRRPETS